MLEGRVRRAGRLQGQVQVARVGRVTYGPMKALAGSWKGGPARREGNRGNVRFTEWFRQ